MSEMNFTSGMADRFRFSTDGNGVAVDTYRKRDGVFITGRRLSADDVQRLVQFLGETGHIPEAAKATPNFEGGDRVKVLVSVSRVNQNMVPGTLGTVEIDEDKAGAVGVRMDDGRIVSLNVGDFERVEPETERTRLYWVGDLKVGDTVVERGPGPEGGSAWATVERVKPVEPPKPTHGFGTAYVFGMVSQGVPQARTRGILSRSGAFTFLNVDGATRIAYRSMFDGFEPEG